jgi:hypothetical protein
MKISPVTNYEMSPVLARLQKMQQDKAVSSIACSCTRSTTSTSNNPCCCGDGMTFFGSYP